MHTVRPFQDFEHASRATLVFLRERIAFDLWMVTRTEGDDWIVLQSEDHGYGVKDGDVFKWADSFCSQMVLGRGPCVAPESDSVPAYAEAPIGQLVNIGAYIGVPISDAEGSLFGTLCAIHPTTQPQSLVDELPTIKFLSRLLSSLLVTELKLTALQRQKHLISTRNTIDSTTGLLNLAGWQKIVNAEERRCKIYGHPASIISVCVDGLDSVDTPECETAEKELAVQLAKTIEGVLGTSDLAARLHGGQFAILAGERNAESTNSLVQALRVSMQTLPVSTKIAFAIRDPRKDLWVAVDEAFKTNAVK